MAAARSAKTAAKLAARGFSLIEILITVAVLSILYGCLFVTGSGLARRFTDPHSDENIAREVAQAAAWFDDLIYSAAMAERDLEIVVPPGASSGVFVRWRDESGTGWREGNGRDEWRSERIGVRVDSTKRPIPTFFRYDWRAQTLTPALALRVFKQNVQYAEATEWFIIISGHGLVRASKTAP